MIPVHWRLHIRSSESKFKEDKITDSTPTIVQKDRINKYISSRTFREQMLQWKPMAVMGSNTGQVKQEVMALGTRKNKSGQELAYRNLATPSTGSGTNYFVMTEEDGS